MKRWIGYAALLIAAAGIWFGTTHRVAAPAQNSQWVARVSQVANSGTQMAAQTGTKPSTSLAHQTTQVLGPSSPSGPSGQRAGSGKTASEPAGTQVNVATSGGTPLAKSTNAAPTVAPSKNVTPVVSAATTGTTAVSVVAKPSSTPTQGSGNGHSPALGTFTILVTLQQGAVTRADKQVPIVAGESLLGYMQKYFSITTTYGGDFIVGIDGIKSQWTGVPTNQRKPVDWFLYVNHQEAPVGAADIIPRAGDVDVWDYHGWNLSTGRG